MHVVPDGVEGREYNAEEVYLMFLCDSNDKGRLSIELSGKHADHAVDRHNVWMVITDETATREAWNKRIQKAISDCQGIVQQPSSIRKIREKLNKRSKVDWKQMLHVFLQYDEYDYSFLPPDRCFSAGDYYLPAYNVDQNRGSAHDIWISMDTSASMTDKELKQAMDEVQDAMRQEGLTESVSFFDGDITKPVSFAIEEEEFMSTIPSGGGQTSYQPIFK